MICVGLVDVVVVGGIEVCISFGVMCVWEVMCVFVDDICCLFSVNCCGLVLGEGVGVFVFEFMVYVCVCGVQVLGVLVGVGMSVDVGDIVVLDLVGSVLVMVQVLVDVGLLFEDIDYINVYGIGMLVNDFIEIIVIYCVFGVYVLKLVVFFIKFMYGYVLGVFGVLELVVVFGVMCDGVVLFIVNFDVFDLVCDLDYVFNMLCELCVCVVFSNFFVFGGFNVVLVVCVF